MKKSHDNKFPDTQQAVQLVGPDKLVLNKSKEVFRPASHQILCRVEAVGLCFSDLKFLKQFSGHPRKGDILSGIDYAVLKQIPSYVPGDLPSVPGHETVIRIEAAGPDVEKYKTGQRYLVQTDYRWLATGSSNAAFGYNFEGALQEYVLMDERVITSPEGDSMLIPVSEKLSSSAVALVEPWACVEDAYSCKERRNLKKGGSALIVADLQLPENTFGKLFDRYGKPARITYISKFPHPSDLEGMIEKAESVSEVGENCCDDIIYFGSDGEQAERLFSKLAPHGLINIVLCGGSFVRDVKTPVGRIHYGGIRIIGTAGANPAESYEYIPETGEIRAGDKINVIGAAGPMGLMHVVRNVCHDIKGISVYAGDIDDARLARLTKIAHPLAKKNNIEYMSYNSKKEKINKSFDYTILMIPAAEFAAESIKTSADKGIINIFAGIPANVSADIDLNSYIKKQLYFIGTSGSTIEDMRAVLKKVEAGRLDTNTSVAAISGLDGAVEGIRAVENRSVAGKIIVYPACKGLGLVRLEDLSNTMPQVDKCLNNDLWTKQAEQELLEKYGRK
ncbi:MAG: alcohol dehydrogenase catalytic domain-containing protein [Sedimentisphaerales bacterium]|nr:alcohol dehydrogenase catalytic domain-containing protein [Sedimentisphaerales bacterium]